MSKNRYIGIDPGDTQTAVVAIETDGTPVLSGIYPNGPELFEAIFAAFRNPRASTLCGIEMVASYGMPVGRTVFETCVWIGRIVQKIRDRERCEPLKVYRLDVKMHLCHQAKAKDANIRQGLIDLYPPTGGGSTPQIGTKSQPGPLYGFAKDQWAALGVAMTVRDKWHEFDRF